MREIRIKINGKALTVNSGLTLSEIVNGEKPCGGHGKCGKCKIIAKGELSPICEAERELLRADELARGVRLACLTHALGYCEIETECNDKKTQIVTEGSVLDVKLNPSFKKYGVAVDIGTTTVAARLYGADGALLATAAQLNPQSKWGADVVSRIEASLSGHTEELSESVRGAVDEIISELVKKANVNADEVGSAVITGNTVMLCLLTKESVEPLSHAPFDVKRLFGENLSACELGLASVHADTPVYLPSCISAFVGADITCAILATNLCKRKNALLADIGTNGEMAFYDGKTISVCSTAAGPAFEGVGISTGMRGEFGAIDKVIHDGEKLDAHVIGGETPIGICGSGLIDAVACMLELDIIDETGFLEDDVCEIKSPISINQNDIRMVQLAKSAVCAGMLTLLSEKQLTANDVDVLYIAGGFGNYLNMKNAERVGLLPVGVADKAQAVGNAALDGASMLLLDGELKNKSEGLAKTSVTLELSTNKIFSDFYINGMFF